MHGDGSTALSHGETEEGRWKEEVVCSVRSMRASLGSTYTASKPSAMLRNWGLARPLGCCSVELRRLFYPDRCGLVYAFPGVLARLLGIGTLQVD